MGDSDFDQLRKDSRFKQMFSDAKERLDTAG